ncbi:TetR/AcrR family transcriptional regulator [Flavobacterium humi]|uniref:TetR/AcrR family transcriptional regulator n=1 Tax=Flavobacterium humi TaxID=2562683 RepID=A0A4Z0LCD1_9FLAO|nr:TetR/AcrR family transcriptional regulator [Flavobacterium humi]TGD59534.1 TetR/AcrR family transcriptional regulator [Flavobacterium humi]
MSKSERTRQFIIEKTAPIFNTKGYAGTSINDITEATKLTKGSVYGNFKNKDEVAVAAFQYNLSKVRKLIADEIAQKESYRDKLKCIPKLYLDFLTDKFPVGGCPIMNTATEADDTHPELRKHAKDAILAWNENLAALINKGKEAHEFKPETNAAEKALLIITLIEGTVMLVKLTGLTSYLKTSMNSIMELIDDL